MIRPSPPRVVVGDRAQVRSDSRAYGGQYRGELGDVINLPFTLATDSADRVCVLVEFKHGVLMFSLSELSILPNAEARRGEPR